MFAQAPHGRKIARGMAGGPAIENANGDIALAGDLGLREVFRGESGGEAGAPVPHERTCT